MNEQDKRASTFPSFFLSLFVPPFALYRPLKRTGRARLGRHPAGDGGVPIISIPGGEKENGQFLDRIGDDYR